MAWKDVHGWIASSLLSLEVVGEKESSGCWEYTEDQGSGCWEYTEDQSSGKSR